MDSDMKDIWDDSGCASGNLESSSSSKACSSSSKLYIETPTTTLNTSRKRKIHFYESEQRRLPITDFLSESPAIFDNNLLSLNFLSSTLNESLTKSLENCNLSNFTPKYPTESSEKDVECERYFKKSKLIDSPKYEPKTRSAPSTPTKHLEIEEINVFEKSHSDNIHLTPQKKFNRITKLGSPERYELLYPSIKSTTSSPKLKTPEKLREFLKKINSPAKKKLFKSDKIEKRPYRKVDTDPISVFIDKNDFRHIVTKIFGYLSDGDLCNVARVSKSWRRALNSDYKAFPRYYEFSMTFQSNKENVQNRYTLISISPPGSPNRGDNFQKCLKIAAQLMPNQSLQKCIKCMSPAVVQKSISQCQNPNCEYIYCKNCFSFSLTGPLNFIDKCNSSELVIDKQNKSNGDLWEDSRYNSSGYMSEHDTTPVIKRRLVPKVKSKGSLPFQICNRREEFVLHHKARRASLVSVVTPTKSTTPIELTEPPSPPKVKVITSSKQSKKNLRRLYM